MQEKTYAVYQINCQQCDAQYIGETSRQIDQRMDEHNKDTRKSSRQSCLLTHKGDRSYYESSGTEALFFLRRATKANYTFNKKAITTAIDIPPIY